MKVTRRSFGHALATGAMAGYVRPWNTPAYAAAVRRRMPEELLRAVERLPPAIITKVSCYGHPSYNRNSITAAFAQSNMIITVETDAGITGIGEGGSPDLIRVLSRSVIGRNAFDTEQLWQFMYMDSFYSPGREKIHALGGIDMALWDIKGKALKVPLYDLFGGKTREHIELYATSGLPSGIEAGPTLQERAAATMAAGYRIYRVDGSINPNPGRGGGGGGRGAAAPAAGAPAAGAPAAGAPAGRGAAAPAAPAPAARGAATPTPAAGTAAPAGAAAQAGAPAVITPGRGGGGGGGGRGGGLGQIFDSRARIRWVIEAGEKIREGLGPDGNWMIDVHQKFDFHEAVEICRGIEPLRPYLAEDPVREEQFRTQIPKLRMLTSVPLAPGEEWGQRWEFNTLVENRDIDYARATLPNVGGITEMLKIMAMCDTHKVGIVPHFTGPVGTCGHMHTMMAFPGQLAMEFNYGMANKTNMAANNLQHVSEFLELRNGKVWPNDRPGLGITLETKNLMLIEEFTVGGGGSTYRRPDGSPSHW